MAYASPTKFAGINDPEVESLRQEFQLSTVSNKYFLNFIYSVEKFVFTLHYLLQSWAGCCV